jgi:transposase
MAERVRARRLTDQEGQRLLSIVRRGSASAVRYRRAMIVLASSSGNTVPAVARLVGAHEDTVRDVIHAFNEIGLRCLNPRWAGHRTRLLSKDQEDYVVAIAAERPGRVGAPFTRWSIRKLQAHLCADPRRPIRIGRETLRTLLARRGVTFQRTRTWKESPDPQKEAKLAAIEDALTHHADATFAFDEFGPLGIRPVHGAGWARSGHPWRLPATYHRTHGVTYFHGCYSIGQDKLWGNNRRRKGAANTLLALKSIRRTRPAEQQIYVILDNLSAHKNKDIRAWAAHNRVTLLFTPTYASWANPIEAQFGPLRQFTMAHSHRADHAEQTRDLHAYLAWRNANSRHPDVLAAPRPERAPVRSEKGVRWGGRARSGLALAA